MLITFITGYKIKKRENHSIHFSQFFFSFLFVRLCLYLFLSTIPFDELCLLAFLVYNERKTLFVIFLSFLFFIIILPGTVISFIVYISVLSFFFYFYFGWWNETYSYSTGEPTQCIYSIFILYDFFSLSLSLFFSFCFYYVLLVFFIVHTVVAEYNNNNNNTNVHLTFIIVKKNRECSIHSMSAQHQSWVEAEADIYLFIFIVFFFLSVCFSDYSFMHFT